MNCELLLPCSNHILLLLLAVWLGYKKKKWPQNIPLIETLEVKITHLLSFKPIPLRLPIQNLIPRLPASNPALGLPAPQRPRSNPPFSRRNPYPIKRISSNQMYKRREKILCYFCNEKYHQQHKCSWPKLCLLEGMEFKEEGKKNLKKKRHLINRT